MHQRIVPVTTSAEVFSGVTEHKSCMYWYASVSVLGYSIAEVGGQRYKTRIAAERAALALAQERLK